MIVCVVIVAKRPARHAEEELSANRQAAIAGKSQEVTMSIAS